MRRAAVLVAVILAGAAGIVAGTWAVLQQPYARQAEVGQLLADARAGRAAGRHDEAAGLFSAYLASRPDDAQARREYTDLLLERIATGKLPPGENDAAFAFLEQAIRETPDDHWLRFQLARLQLRIHELTPAIEHLTLLRQTCGADREIRLSGAAAGRSIHRHEIDSLFVEALVKTGRFREAVNVLSDAVGFDPVARRFRENAPAPHDQPAKSAVSVGVFQQLASLLAEEFHDEQAAGLVHARNTVVNADDPMVWITLAGWKYFREHDLESAQEAARKAIELAPDDSAVMDTSFRMAVYGERYDEAAAIAARGLELHPGQEWPYKSSVAIALRAGDVTGAIDPLVGGLQKLGPQLGLLQTLVDLPFEPAWNEALKSRLDEVEPVVARDERFRQVLAGRKLMVEGRWLEAAKVFESARPLAASLPALKLTIDLALAKCHERLGDTDLQLADYQRALVENLGSVEARIGVAIALEAGGHLQAALAEWHRVADDLQVARIAGRPEVWLPWVRVELAASAQGLPGHRSREQIDAFVAALEAVVAADQAPLLEAELLASEGKYPDALAVLAAARVAAPADAALAAAAVSLHARSGDAPGVVDLVKALPSPVQDDPAVMGAAADACRLLPPAAVDEVAAQLHGRHPDDLRAAMTLLHTKLALGRPVDVAAVAGNIASLAGTESTYARYAAAASWVLGGRLPGSRLAEGDKRELARIRQSLATVEFERPHWADLLRLLANVDLLDGRTDDAIARFQQVLAARPSDRDVACELAKLLIQRRRVAEAEKLMEHLDEPALASLGRPAAEMRLRAGKVDAAIAIATRAVESEDRNPDELLWFSELLAGHGQRAAAIAALERSVILRPGAVELWLALADQEAAGGGSGALAILERAAEAVAEEARPIVRAEQDRRSGRKDEAAASYRRLLEPSLPEPLVMRRAAGCFADAGLAGEARATLERLAGIRPATESARQAQRWARRRLAELDLREGSFPLAEKALQMLGENAAVRGTYAAEDVALAATLLAARPEPGSWRKALELLQAAGKQQPTTIRQQVLAARLRDRLGDWRRAREDLRTLAVEPGMPAEVYEAFVELLIAHDDPKAAQTWIGELRSLASSAPKTIELEARLALAKGDRPAAVAAAKRLMPVGDVTRDDVPAVLATATTMEAMGFMAAADNLLTRAAAVSTAGMAAHIAYLIRRDRVTEAAELFAASRDSLTVEPECPLLEAWLFEVTGRLEDAEKGYRSIAAAPDAAADMRARATARLAFLLLDRDDHAEAQRLVEPAILTLGPHPDLLDARGSARIVAGNVAGALSDLSEAVLTPTASRWLHLARAKAPAQDDREARALLERALASGLDAGTLRPLDRRWLEFLLKKS